MRKTSRTVAVGIATLSAATLLSTTAAAVPTAEQSASQASSQSTDAARTLLVLTESGKLVHYKSSFPLLPKKIVQIKGVAAKDKLIGIDVRPATGELYAIAASGQLYTVDKNTGAATKVGSPIALDGKAVGFDFNPTVDRIRLVTNTGQNLRLVPDTGALAATDLPLSYQETSGAKPNVTAAGYTDSVAGATSTGLYGLDTKRDTLVTQGSLPGATPAVSPNDGKLFTVGKLSLPAGDVNGFDIAGTAKEPGKFNPSDYTAYAAIKPSALPVSLIVRVDLATGKTRPVGGLFGNSVGLTFSE